jgi:hypothetical protein
MAIFGARLQNIGILTDVSSRDSRPRTDPGVIGLLKQGGGMVSTSPPLCDDQSDESFERVLAD